MVAPDFGSAVFQCLKHSTFKNPSLFDILTYYCPFKIFRLLVFLFFFLLQIDGSTLRTICMQHGPLLTFHLGLTQGTALIRYSSRQEAAKAQSALHM